jgi:hypothetical protein
LKLQVTITGAGFNQDEDEYTILVTGGNKSIRYTQDDIIDGDDENKYIIVPTEQLAPGTMDMIVAAYVPDSDVSGGRRKEVVAVNIGVIRPAKNIE